MSNTKFENEHLSYDELKHWIKTDPTIQKKLKQKSKQFDKDYGYVDDPEKELGYHYLFCPLTEVYYIKFNSRFSNMLKVSPERLKEISPESTKQAPEMINRTKDKLNEIDPETGMTIRESAHKKSIETLNSIDPETGKRRYDMLGEKTKATHQNNLDEYGFNGYQLQASSNIKSSNITRKELDEQYGGKDGEFERYERMVEWALNKIRPSYKAQGYEFCRRGQEYNHPNKKQLDHKFSISAGYKQKVSPLCLMHKDNIEVLSVINNATKSDKCSLTIEDLCNMNNISFENIQSEFHEIMELIREDLNNNVPHSTVDVIKRLEKRNGVVERVYNINIIYHTYRDYASDEDIA